MPVKDAASGSKVNSCPLSSHEIDGVRKEKERLTAASLNKRSNRSSMEVPIVFSD